MIRLALASLAALALLAGCGDDEQETAATPVPTEAATFTPAEISKDLDSAPTIPKPEGEPPSELVIDDVVKGKGKKARPGDTVSVQYTGTSFSTGMKFDASWDRGAQPFQFTLGRGEVIPGWDEGVAGMRVGGRRQLVIPPDMGYGAQGSPPVIAPNETLIFVVDLVRVR